MNNIRVLDKNHLQIIILSRIIIKVSYPELNYATNT